MSGTVFFFIPSLVILVLRVLGVNAQHLYGSFLAVYLPRGLVEYADIKGG